MNTGLLALLAETARERRIRQGRDTETNLARELGRAPTRQELLARMTAELDSMFGRKEIQP